MCNNYAGYACGNSGVCDEGVMIVTFVFVPEIQNKVFAISVTTDFNSHLQLLNNNLIGIKVGIRRVSKRFAGDA